MIRLLPFPAIIALGFALAAHTSVSEYCTMVMIWKDGEVTIDWPCVDALAAKWKPGSGDTDVSYAHVLKAVREGRVK